MFIYFVNNWITEILKTICFIIFSFGLFKMFDNNIYIYISEYMLPCSNYIHIYVYLL